MTYDEIWPHVVDGFRVTCERFGPGTFVDYQFNGLRINHAGGSSSGFTATEADRACEWSLVPDECSTCEGEGAINLETSKPIECVECGVLVADDKGGWVIPPDDKGNGVWGKRETGDRTVEDCRDKFPSPEPVGKWGKPVAKDSWGRPLPTTNKWGK